MEVNFSERQVKPSHVSSIEIHHVTLDHYPVSVNELINSDFDTTSPFVKDYDEGCRGKSVLCGWGPQMIIWEDRRGGISYTQFTVLAANIKNAKGYSKLFHGAITVMRTLFKSIATGLSGIGREASSA
ncbi:MAG: hypothetical protein LBP19_07540 [Treponema sp.]|jgi:hypothetical protein|nr:hypothetical protein [Treponema sp.]